MTLPLLFAFSFVVGFGAVVTPGPVSTAIVSESARRGFVVGPLVATGHVILEFIMVGLLAFGLSAGLNTPSVTTTIALIGGALLLWMGGGMVWAAFKGKIALPKPGVDVKLLSNWQLIGLGMGATIVNPFWYAWWVTVGATYLAFPQVQAFGLVGLLVFYFGHITGDYLWDSILSGVVGGGRKWITDTLYKWIIVACGAYLIYLGGVFITTPFVSR
ncbi:MAG TPA: LysE family translocator [Anaerolineales bacterium]|nr:LysE family translocator [Anaerolineales bacterium]